jgi:aryl-alcohol dehydrogenase-like predicted oxidoreductase
VGDVVMEQRRVGGSDVRLSVVGLGGASLGQDPEDQEQVARTLEVLRSAADAGMNWVDTSENYFDTGNEAVIGAALRELSASFLICTKVAPGEALSGGGSGFRPEQIRAACEASLRRLDREHLDIYLLHWPDESGVPLEDTWAAMAGLVDDGLVRAIGLSNYERDDIARCHEERPVDVIETGLSILDYLDDRELITWCGEHGIAVTIYEPLAGGLLSDAPFEQVRDKWLGTAWEDSAWFTRLFSTDNAQRTKHVVDGLRDIATRLGVTVAQVALAWVLRQPGVTSALAGSGDPGRTRANAGAADVELTNDAMHAIDELIRHGPAFA